MKTDKKAVEGMFKVFVKTIGGRVAESYNDEGAYRLDYVACYGGYNIEQIHNKAGGVDQPFGSTRRKPTEMWDTLHFAVRALEQYQRTKEVQP